MGTFGKLGKQLRTLFSVQKRFDDETKEQIEEILLLGDVGPFATAKLIATLEQAHRKNALHSPMATLEHDIAHKLKPREIHLLPPPDGKLHTILVVGTNGVGKTTSIAKLAHFYAKMGYAPIIAAGDTFRAAATEQLQTWGHRLQIDVIAHHQGGDSSAVIFDTIHAAKARGKTLVLADTAGRLHNKEQLLNELTKIHKTALKADVDNTLHTLLVLDATTGVATVDMVRLFGQATPLAATMITKLDSGAKGGSLLAMDDSLAIPIAFLGTGEQLEDIQIFRADFFAKQLLA